MSVSWNIQNLLRFSLAKGYISTSFPKSEFLWAFLCCFARLAGLFALIAGLFVLIWRSRWRHLGSRLVEEPQERLHRYRLSRWNNSHVAMVSLPFAHWLFLATHRQIVLFNIAQPMLDTNLEWWRWILMPLEQVCYLMFGFSLSSVVVSSSMDNHIRLWDIESNKLLRDIEPGSGSLEYL